MNKDKNIILKSIKILILCLICLFAFIGGIIGVAGVRAMQLAPQVNPEEINNMMNQTSEILDQDGNLIEKIRTTEYREVVKLDKIPKYMMDAFISVEDERFHKHNGLDPIGIASAIFDNISSGSMKRGASTLAQQLARNLYLSNERSFDRKFKEAYLALQLTHYLGREKLLETYMNTVFLGQNAYGVQAAAEIYFKKNVNELTLSECATLAGIVKSPTNLALYKAIEPGQVKDQSKIVGEVNLAGETYKAVYNQTTIKRRDYVLKKMLDNKKITQQEYDNALKENIAKQIKPGIKNIDNLSNYYSDIIYEQVISKLMEKGYTQQEAKSKLINGGLKIYSCVDMNMQNKLEELYDKKVDEIISDGSTYSLLQWSSDNQRNITNSKKEVIYFKKNNLLNDSDEFFISPSDYVKNPDGSITFKYSKSIKVKQYGNYLDLKDYYSVNETNNLVTHKISSINIGKNNLSTSDNGDITINDEYIKKNPNLLKFDNQNNLIFTKDFYTINEDGIKQPQSSSVVLDKTTGQIKALVGGRFSNKKDTTNRASDIPRQVGSSMKPLGVYTPALDNGYSPASGLEDLPHYNEKHELWPKNWYEGYEGLVSLRHAVENSINVTAVKVLEDIGIEKSKTYLEKFGLINAKNPRADNYISAAENNSENDENTSAMALGSLTKGFTPVEMAGAYNALNNEGKYREPISFTKITDSLGKVIIENPQKQNEVVSTQIAYIMRDILRTSTDYNYSKYARLDGFDIAGKTGTTSDYQDVWFCGMSPYYTISTWLGFDNQQLKMTQISQKKVVQIWSVVNKYTLEDKIPIKFDEPDGIIRLEVDTLANKLPSKYSRRDPRGTVKEEIYKAGTQPTEVSDLYVSRRIDVVDGKLATDNTPPWELGWGVFIKREPPYKPEDNNNIIPKDWKYCMPGYSDRTIFNILKPEEDEKEDKDKDKDKNKDEKEKKPSNKDDKSTDKKDSSGKTRDSNSSDSKTN